MLQALFTGTIFTEGPYTTINMQHATSKSQRWLVEGGSFSYRPFVMRFDISRTRAVTTVGVGSEMGISFPSKNNFFEEMKF